MKETRGECHSFIEEHHTLYLFNIVQYPCNMLVPVLAGINTRFLTNLYFHPSLLRSSNKINWRKRVDENTCGEQRLADDLNGSTRSQS